MAEEMYQGLSSAEAIRRLSAGYNELAPPHARRGWEICAEVLKEPMFLFMIAAGSIYLLLGDMLDAMMLMFFVLIVVGITVFQTQRNIRVQEALRDLSSPRARVMRDGKVFRIPGREVVPGDILLLSEGDRVAADALLLSCNDLYVDESMLTGESVPVNKLPGKEDAELTEPGGDGLSQIFAGTLLVQGAGVARVVATGKFSAIGRIGTAMEEAVAGVSPLRQQLDRMVGRIALVAVVLCLLLVLIYGFSRGHWLNALLAGISLAMSTLPEEFPVIFSVFMSLGAWRISRHHVLTRRMDAIETLGAATLLCTDKTGTLTENKMVIRKLYASGQMLEVREGGDLPEPWHELVEFGILASEREPIDPMERALHELGLRTLNGSEHLHGSWQIVHEYSLSSDLMAMSHVWNGDGAPEVAAKGAPEAIIELCHLDQEAAAGIDHIAGMMADQGLRVLGVARGSLPQGLSDWPKIQHDIDYVFVGLIGLYDPLRAGVEEAVRQCYAAGIRVVMMTGDHVRTAQAIARELAFSAGQVLTGKELDTLSDEALRARLKNVQVCARIAPWQKLRLVEAFKASGEVVAMTGDGVNDAPALKAAHIGVAMGRRGTDVAREAAALVLLEDDFASLVLAVRLGRRIHDNLRRAMSYTVSVHLPIVGMALLPALTGQAMLLLPAHIMFMELIIGVVCSIFFEAEPEEADIMNRPPRPAGDTIFSAGRLKSSLLQGGAAFAVCASVYLLAWHFSGVEDEVRAMVFSAMVGTNLALILINRAQHADTINPALAWVLACSSAGLLLVLAVPLLREVFHLAGDAPSVFAVALAALLVLYLGLKLLSGFKKGLVDSGVV